MKQKGCCAVPLPDLVIDCECARTGGEIVFALEYDPQWGFCDQNYGLLLGIWVTLPEGKRRPYSHPSDMLVALQRSALPHRATQAWFIFHDRSECLDSLSAGIKIIRAAHHAVCPGA